ncbi:MAG: ABC-F family ATP-binding cassette domain-containing protein [Oligoflexales bacterium]|nr:ABC-F family ATP-binding cassette domain-containing protein [Oligoflexales bacterium]
MSSNLLQVQNAYKSYGKKLLFEDASFSINEDEHVGVIGPNGAGKTTLFKILAKGEELDHGTIIKSKNLRIGYLEQEVVWRDDETLESYLEDCRKPIWELKSMAKSLGLTPEHFHVNLNSLSGGYRMRCKLLYLLGCEPNLMLLDEPTNYLDLETILVLESFLQDYRGAFLLISHDREFLKRTTDHTLEVEQGDITKYNGHIDDYFEQKQLLREQLEKSASAQMQKRKIIEDFVARFGAKATKARQAQSRLKALNKMESIEIKPLNVTSRFRLPTPPNTGRVVINASHLDLGYEDRTILRDVNLQIEAGDHIGVIGYNGAGKSTLLKAFASALKPRGGEIKYGLRVEIAYYGQHVAEELDLNLSVIDELAKDAHKEILHQQILDLAGSLLFSGDSVYKPIKVLSGGEKARVALGKILLKKAPLIILDEPSNHLDFDTVESLTQALCAYPGTIIFVSHDRSFVQRVAKKIFEVKNGVVETYLGSYEEYVWSVQTHNQQISNEISGGKEAPRADKFKKNEASNRSSNHDSQQIKNLDKLIRQKRVQTKQHESEVAALQQQISVKSLALENSNPEQLISLGRELAELQKKLDYSEALWLENLEELEKLEK